IEIDVGVQRRPRLGIEIQSRRGLTHLPSARVDLVVANTLAAAQNFLVFLFDAALTDELPGLVALVRRRIEIGIRDFTGVAHERRDRGSIRIEPLRYRLNDEPRKVDAMLFQYRYDAHRRVGHDQS